MKIIPRVMAVLLSIAVYLSCVSTYASAGMYTFIADVTPIKQAKPNWCWAACAEMVGKSVNPNSKRTQYDVVQYLKGNQNDQTGKVSDIVLGCEYVSHNSKNFTFGMLKPEGLVQRILPREGVVAVLTQRNGTGGHAVVIRQINMNVIVWGDNTTTTNYSVGYVDPATGGTYVCTYESFCNDHFGDLKLTAMVYTV